MRLASHVKEVDGVMVPAERVWTCLDGRYIIAQCPWSGRVRWARKHGQDTSLGIPGHGATRSRRAAVEACKEDLATREGAGL